MNTIQEESIIEDTQDLPVWHYTHDTEEEYLLDQKEIKRRAVIKMEKQLKQKGKPFNADQIDTIQRRMKAGCDSRGYYKS